MKIKRVLYFSLLVFFEKVSKFQSHLCNRCHDLLITTMNLRNIAISKIKNADYPDLNTRISKYEAINLLQNIDFNEKKWNIKIRNNFDAINVLETLI